MGWGRCDTFGVLSKCERHLARVTSDLDVDISKTLKGFRDREFELIISLRLIEAEGC